MKKAITLLTVIFILVYVAGCPQGAENQNKEAIQASGTVVDGYRVLPIQKSEDKLRLTVYRGDYIKFDFGRISQEPLLTIPELSIRSLLPDNPADAPYFKMKDAGTYAFSVGEIKGELIVVNYQEPHYREVSANDAARLIDAEQPLILDVRTPIEFENGHVADALLIPVQELQGRLSELASFKNREILVYCATGNRSTVASKILIDNGFSQITNMRHGMVDWVKNKLPVIR